MVSSTLPKNERKKKLRNIQNNSYNKLREQKKMYRENKNFHEIKNAPFRNDWGKKISACISSP